MKKWFSQQWRKIKAWFYGVLIAIGLVAPLALANDNTLTWENATQNEDGTALAITDIAETRLYRQDFPLGTDIASEPRSYSQLVSVPPTVTSYADQDLANGIYCYVATHVHVNGQESVFSGEACKTVDVRVPGSPVNLDVT